MIAAPHYIYQRVHVLDGRALRLSDHLRVAELALGTIYGIETKLDERAIAAKIADVTARSHRAGSETVLVYFVPAQDSGGSGRGDGTSGDGCTVSVERERVLLDKGYAVSSLRPVAVSFDYSVPFPQFPTNFHLSARALYDDLARKRYGAGRAVRREGERLVSCGDAPLLGIRGRWLYAPMSIESVEHGLVVEAALRMGLRVSEEPIYASGLKKLDELFYADAAGITSLSECDGAKFMSLTVERILMGIPIKNEKVKR